LDIRAGPSTAATSDVIVQASTLPRTGGISSFYSGTGADAARGWRSDLSLDPMRSRPTTFAQRLMKRIIGWPIRNI